MNRLFVAYKPPFISSNHFLSKIKRKYRVKKAGFSGTLDPFAKGVLIIAFGQYTKLFRFLKKSPKEYIATLWLGTKSDTLDIEKINEIENILPFYYEKIEKVVKSLKGEIKYQPPKFSAKRVDGVRAYELARKNRDFEFKEIVSEIYDIEILNYCHPFLTFKAVVSEGTYIRSLGELIAKKLGTTGALSSLERVQEGEFIYENEKALNPIKFLKTKENFTDKTKEEILNGKKLFLNDLKYKDDGVYHIVFDNFFSIIEVKDKKVKYLLNNIPLEQK